MAPLHDQKVVFIHLPKAGGTTLMDIMYDQYAAGTVYAIDNTIPEQSLTAFNQLDDSRRQRIQVLTGHIAFSHDPYLPGNSTYITLLRDPVERIISFYYYIIRRPDHFLYETITANKWSLQDCLRNAASIEFDNLQTRRLYGEAADHIGFGQLTDDILQAALDNLKNHFSVIGTVDRFDETLILLNKKLGWNVSHYAKKNIGSNKPRELGQDTIDLIKTYNQCDIALYEFGKNWLQQEVNAQGISFTIALERLKLLNSVYAIRSRVNGKLKRMKRK